VFIRALGAIDFGKNGSRDIVSLKATILKKFTCTTVYKTKFHPLCSTVAVQRPLHKTGFCVLPASPVGEWTGSEKLADLLSL
jgi:hypothetical protein